MQNTDKPRKLAYLKVSELTPYANNARKHSAKQVNMLAESISEFGFVAPVLIDKNGHILAGHGRIEAAKQLGMEKVPCCYIEGLTEEQKKAYILADNRLQELSEWDMELVTSELEALDAADFNVDLTGFSLDDIFDQTETAIDSYFGDERERTNNAYNLDNFDSNRAAGFYDMPILQACDYIPDDLIGFNYALSSKEHEKGIHFFIDDYQFERVWNNPAKYIDIISKYACALTPDFSLYMDMPRAMKVWNIYRSRLIGQMMQDVGIEVIPTLSWAEPETFQFCFDGIEPGGTVAVSTVGVMNDKESKKIWAAGMDEAIKRIQPKTVICYGSKIDYKFKCDVKYIGARKFKE